MKRLTKTLATGAVIAASVFGAATPSALADTSALHLGCFVDSPALDVVTSGRCAARHAASQYTVYFEVLDRSATGYTFNWRSTGLPIVPTAGCTSSSPICMGTVRPAGDSSLTTTVVVTEIATGESKTVTARADFFSVCGRFFC